MQLQNNISGEECLPIRYDGSQVKNICRLAVVIHHSQITMMSYNQRVCSDPKLDVALASNIIAIYVVMFLIQLAAA